MFWTPMSTQVLRLAIAFRVRAIKGSITVARFSIYFLTKLAMPSTDRSFRIFVGVGRSMIALVRSLLIRMPSVDEKRPRYFTPFWSNSTLDDSGVSPAAWSTPHLSPKRHKRASQFAEQTITSSIYTNKPLFDRKFANVNDMTC